MSGMLPRQSLAQDSPLFTTTSSNVAGRTSTARPAMSLSASVPFSHVLHCCGPRWTPIRRRMVYRPLLRCSRRSQRPTRTRYLSFGRVRARTACVAYEEALGGSRFRQGTACGTGEAVAAKGQQRTRRRAALLRARAGWARVDEILLPSPRALGGRGRRLTSRARAKPFVSRRRK